LVCLVYFSVLVCCTKKNLATLEPTPSSVEARKT
jgi:hypothetical protein